MLGRLSTFLRARTRFKFPEIRKSKSALLCRNLHVLILRKAPPLMKINIGRLTNSLVDHVITRSLHFLVSPPNLFFNIIIAHTTLM